jgi:hypothetical protein
MRNALLFDDVIQFTDFVRVYGSSTSSSGGFTAYFVRDPNRPAHTQVILLGFRRRKGMSYEENPMILDTIQVEEKGDDLYGKYSGGSKQQLGVQSKSRGLSLIELIELREWKEEPPRGRLLFWLRDPQLMSRLVTDSFKLGNDRIQYAPIEQNDQKIMLLRIENPSYYLLQLCQEQHNDLVDLFYSPSEDLYIEWGYQHPLEDIWRRSHHRKNKEWIMFRAEGQREHVSPPQWQDVYKATDFVLDFPVDDLWIQDAEREVEFKLPLRFEPRARPLEPDLWMLEEDEQYLLEQLLSLVDEQDLKTLLISVQESEDQRVRFFIREKHHGEGRKFLDFKGRRFASYKGFHNLLLPVELELQPQLRRDQYRDLFTLRNGELTVLIADTQETKDGRFSLKQTHMLKLKENSFEPITRLIDYLVTSDVRQLTNILEKSIFDFGHYAKAPRRSDLLSRPAQKREKKEKDSKDKKDKGIQSIEPKKSKKKLKKKPVLKKTTKKDKNEHTEPEEELHIEPSELEKEEARIERILVTEGQHPDHWQDLSGTKGMMQKWNDSATSAFEGLWLLQDGQDYNELRDHLTEVLDQFQGFNGTPAQRIKRALSAAQKKAEPFAVAAYVLHGHDESEDRIDEWLQHATNLMRQAEDQMRKKERWLLWREVFKRNKDTREQARVREAILTDLNQNGITNQDVPMFIQERLFQERWLQDEDAENDSTSEVGAAYRNLEQIVGVVQNFPLPRLKGPGLGVLARAFARIGHHPRAKEIIDAARSTMDDLELDSQVWLQLYTVEAVSFQSKGEGERLRKTYQTMCQELKKANASHLKQIEKMEKSLEERKELDNLSEYLSKENNKRLFPSSTNSASAPIKARLDAIETSYQAGEFERVGQEVISVLEYIRDELSGKKRDPDFRTLAWLLDSSISTLGKLKWGNEGRELIREFESFVSAIPKQPPENSAKLADFYFTLLHLAMSEGLVALGSEPFAMQHLQDLLAWTFDRDLVPLDYVDMCSKALNTIEVAQLKNRQEPLKLIMRGMERQLNSPQNGNSYDNPSFAAIALRLLDQIVEVALSKEKLTLGLFKRYTDQDELLIRERIFTEDACA